MNTQASNLTEACFRILLCILGILGNMSLLIFSMPSITCRIEPYKVLLINLAFSNLITNFMVDIPSILVEIYGTWFLGDGYCKIFWFTAGLSITNSILTTLALSVFWFHKVVGYKLKNSTLCRESEFRLVKISIGLGWVVSITFSAPMLYFCSIYMLKNDNQIRDQPPPERIFGCHDVFPSSFHKNLYVILYLSLANALPIIGMFFINVRIILFLVRSRKRIMSLKCAKNKVTSSCNSSVPRCGGNFETTCQDSEGQQGDTCTTVRGMLYQPPGPCSSLTTSKLDYVVSEKLHAKSEDVVSVIFKNVDKDIVIHQFLKSSAHNMDETKEQRHPSASIIYDPFMVNHMQQAQKTVLCNLKANHLVLIPEKDIIFVTGNIDQQELCGPVDAYTNACSQDLMVGAQNQSTAVNDRVEKRNIKDLLLLKTVTTNLSITAQIRAALSIMAVVGVFSMFWITYLTLRIKESTTDTEDVIDTASLMAATYTTVIPYIFIYSMKKCPCG